MLRGSVLICVYFVSITITHTQSRLLLVSLYAKQEQQIDLTVTTELERFLVVHGVGIAREHSTDTKQLMRKLTGLPDDELIQSFRSAYSSGSLLLHITGSRNTNILLELVSVIAKTTLPAGAVQSNNQAAVGVITFSAVLSTVDEPIRIAAERYQAMIITISNIC